MSMMRAFRCHESEIMVQLRICNGVQSASVTKTNHVKKLRTKQVELKGVSTEVYKKSVNDLDKSESEVGSRCCGDQLFITCRTRRSRWAILSITLFPPISPAHATLPAHKTTTSGS